MMEKIIRKLAKSTKYQFLYARFKKTNNVKLFNNDIDFSVIQLNFLLWLETYYALYQDLVYNKKYISEDVIDNDIRCDAYLMYRNKYADKEEKDSIKNKNQKMPHSPGTSPGSVIFRKKR